MLTSRQPPFHPPMSGMLGPPTRSCASRILIGHVQSADSFPAPGRLARHVLRPRPRQALLHPRRTYHPTTSAAAPTPDSLGIRHLCSERAVSPGSLHPAPSRRRWFARPGMTMNASSMVLLSSVTDPGQGYGGSRIQDLIHFHVCGCLNMKISYSYPASRMQPAEGLRAGCCFFPH